MGEGRGEDVEVAAENPRLPHAAFESRVGASKHGDANDENWPWLARINMNTDLILARTEKIDLPIDSKNKPSCRLVCDEPTFVLCFYFT
jgi:hypothetical protein